MVSPIDDYWLENIALDHQIGAGIFLPFVIARLGEGKPATEAVLSVKLCDVGSDGERLSRLRLVWPVGMASLQPLGVPERTVTEWAAYGVACAVLARYTSLRIRAITGDGDRFDYWVSDALREYGLEISGTTTGDLAARWRAKVSQLRANPYGVDGLVIVVGFATKEVIFSFHRYEESQQ